MSASNDVGIHCCANVGGLHDVFVATCIERDLPGPRIGERAHHDDVGPPSGGEPSDPADGVPAVDGRHVEIHEHDVGLEARDVAHRSSAVDRDVHATAEAFEQPDGDLSLLRVVLDDEDVEERQRRFVREPARQRSHVPRAAAVDESCKREHPNIERTLGKRPGNSNRSGAATGHGGRKKVRRRDG